MTNEERDAILIRMDTTLKRIEREYVFKQAFFPVKAIPYGLAGSIFVAVLAAVTVQVLP